MTKESARLSAMTEMYTRLLIMELEIETARAGLTPVIQTGAIVLKQSSQGETLSAEQLAQLLAFESDDPVATATNLITAAGTLIQKLARKWLDGLLVVEIVQVNGTAFTLAVHGSESAKDLERVLQRLSTIRAHLHHAHGYAESCISLIRE